MVDSLVQFLATHDAPCPKCGYNLRSVQSPTCPECGLQLSLSIRPDRPSVTSWCALLLFLAILRPCRVKLPNESREPRRVGYGRDRTT